MKPDDPLRSEPARATAALAQVEHALEEAVEQAIEATERTLAQRCGAGCARGLRWTLRATFVAAIVAYFAFGALLLAVRYWMMPRIDAYRPALEREASRLLGADVRIGRVDASWRAFNPHLRFDDVRLLDANGAVRLALPQLEATLSWASVPALALRFASLAILAPELDVRRLPGGRFAVAGFAVDAAGGGDGGAADWLLAQKHVAIRHATLRYTDETQPAAQPLVFEDVNLVLEAGFASHRFALQARPPADLASPIDVRARFDHGWGGRPSDARHWRGRVFAQMDYADVARIAALAHVPAASVAIARGHGALRAWLDFDALAATRLTADVALTDVDARLAADLEPLRLSAVRGRFTQRVWGSAFEGGQEFALARFSVQAEHFALPPTDMRLRLTRAIDDRPQRGELDASVVSLDTLSALAVHVPLARDLRAFVARHAVRGRLADLKLAWEGDPAAPTRFSLRSRFDGLSSNAQSAEPLPAPAKVAAAERPRPGLPGFENLFGSIEATEAGGTVLLDARDAVLEFPGVFEEPRLPLRQFAARLDWTTRPQLDLRIDGLVASNDDLELAASGSYRSSSKGPGLVDLSGRIVRAQAAAAYRYVPLAAGAATRAWLRRALVAGEAVEGNFRLRGDLRDFPFNDPRTGEFRVAARVRNGTLDYMPAANAAEGRDERADDTGKPAPHAAERAWPRIEGIDAELLFERQRMAITGRRGSIYGVQLANVKVAIPDLGARDAHLLIGGEANGPLADMLRYVNASPVGGWLGDFLAGAQASGTGRLALKLDIPLGNARGTQVAGDVVFQNSDIALGADIPPFARAAGRVEFTERSLRISNATASFVGGQVRLGATTADDGAIAITAAGTATPQGVKRAVQNALVQRLLDRAQGTTRYTGTVTVRTRQSNADAPGPRSGQSARAAPEIRIDSDLVGWSFDLPAPARKAAAEALPLRFELLAAGPDRDSLRVTAGALLALRLERERAPGGAMRVARGAIGIGEAIPLPEAGVLASANLARLDVDRWLPLLDSGAGADGADAQRAGDGGLPDLLAARVGELVIAGKPIANVVLGATRAADGRWDANVVSDHATGAIAWRPGAGAAPGRVSARLARLAIPDAQRSDVTELLDAPPVDIPGLDVVVDSFELAGRKLGRLELVAQNVAADGGSAWRMDKLEIVNPDGRLSATGRWEREAGAPANAPRRMRMTMSLEFGNAGALLARLGIPDAVRNGSGKLEGELAWRGSPLAIDYRSLAGRLQLAAAKGQFLKADTGAARLLGVMSLQSLPRRIALDFRDVFSEGFAFDRIDASAEVMGGTLTTRDFKMRGVSATVLIEGSTDLSNETQNLHVLVLPEIDARSASLVYALIANPAIGLGTFVAQMLLRDPLSKAFSFEYDVSGSWNDPQVKRRERAAANAGDARKQ
ncbi:MAG: YhdP family protein [Burkholderiaceae bacterium]